jgi:alpha-tubulin suppressor-like RCC1 family protein
VSADYDFACGLTAAGEAYCWGGGLEILSPDYDGSAVPVMSSVHFTSLALEYGMACGVDTAGATVCLHRRFLYRSVSPPPFADGFTSVVPGSGFRCGLHSDGQALCSTAYIPGTGGSWSMYSDLTPVQAPRPLAQLTAGGTRVCGLTADGLAYCWTVSVGSLSGGTSGGVTIPVAISGEHHFVQISATSTHACGVTAEGEIYCWGDNGAGELGNGTVGGSSDAPVRVTDPV